MAGTIMVLALQQMSSTNLLGMLSAAVILYGITLVILQPSMITDIRELIAGNK